MSGPTSEKLAHFVSALRYDALPADIVQCTKRILLDDLGSIIGGFSEPEASALGNRLAASRGGETSTILGIGFPRVAPADAALANGTAGVGLETDGGYRFASCHASSYVIPTALALAEATGANGRRMIEAIVAGYEVAARLAAATSLARPLMPHGVWSAPGAAAAAARLFDLGSPATAAAIDLGVMLTTNAAFTGRFEGATVRNTYNGLGGQSGILAAELARGGTIVEIDAVNAVFASLSGDSFDRARALEGLGQSYAIGFHYHKRWSCCGFVHPSLDAVAEMMAEDPIDPTEIASIDVGTFREGAELFDRVPTRPLAARHSVPWAVAALIKFGSLSPDAFSVRTLDQPEIRNLASKINVFHDEGLPSGFSKHRSARVVIRYRNGRQRVHECQNVQGDFSTPFSDATHLKKFTMLVEPILGRENTCRLAEAILAIERSDDVRSLTASFAKCVWTMTTTGRADIADTAPAVPVPQTDFNYLDAVSASIFESRSDRELEAAAEMLDADYAAIQQGQEIATSHGYPEGNKPVVMQGIGAEGHALRLGLAGAQADATRTRSRSRLVVSAAALALAHYAASPRDRLLQAASAGDHVALRFERSVELRGEYANAGLWGLLGAAVACGLLKGFGSEKIMQTMNVAASLTLAAPIGANADPAGPAIVGEASFRGVLATTLVDAGYNGLRDGVGFTFGKLVGHRITRAGLLAPREANTSV